MIFPENFSHIKSVSSAVFHVANSFIFEVIWKNSIFVNQMTFKSCNKGIQIYGKCRNNNILPATCCGNMYATAYAYINCRLYRWQCMLLFYYSYFSLIICMLLHTLILYILLYVRAFETWRMALTLLAHTFYVTVVCEKHIYIYAYWK